MVSIDWILAIGLFVFGIGCCLLAERVDRKERRRLEQMRREARLIRRYSRDG